MTGTVWDASAVLAYLRREPGVEALEARLKAEDYPWISAVNLAEIWSWLSERGMPQTILAAALDELALEVVAFDEAQAMTSGILRTATRALGLSLGDRACLALAMERGAKVLTADRTWAPLDLGVSIECIR